MPWRRGCDTTQDRLGVAGAARAAGRGVKSLVRAVEARAAGCAYTQRVLQLVEAGAAGMGCAHDVELGDAVAEADNHVAATVMRIVPIRKTSMSVQASRCPPLRPPCFANAPSASASVHPDLDVGPAHQPEHVVIDGRLGRDVGEQDPRRHRGTPAWSMRFHRPAAGLGVLSAFSSSV